MRLLLLSRLPRPLPLSHLPPRPSTILATTHATSDFSTRFSTRHSSNSGITEDWKGTPTHENATHRAKKHDVTDPEVEATDAGLREREENEGIADETKQQGTTERQGLKFNRKAKEERPNAPEPVIGMNDERGQVCSNVLLWILIVLVM